MLIAMLQAPKAQDFHFDEVTYTPQNTTFKLFAPKEANRVVVRLYESKKENGYAKVSERKMKYMPGGYWQLVVKGDLEGKYYAFAVADKGKAFLPETPGVFAKAVGVNGMLGCVVDMPKTDPDGWQNDKILPLRSPADLVIYEMHHRDFSIARNINLDADMMAKRAATAYPGKFLALTEPWAISHLKDLGVNAVHILPSYDFGSVNETRLHTAQYNWGYDPVNYNVPDGSYSTNPYDPACRIREFKQMVMALHKAGIRVILDVVYNHTYNIEGSNFQRTYPDYYYRKTADGQYSNGSGCGNETASDKAMMRRFMIESVKYWMNEYHIDGFRFDLMGVHDIETMNAIRQAADSIDPSVFIYGEGWSAGACALNDRQLATKGHIPQMPRIAAFSDEMRDALRGPFSDEKVGAFLAGLPGYEESIKAGIAGMTAHPQVDYSKVNYTKEPWATEPTQMICYVSCHDDMCLVDRLKTSIPDLDTEALIRLDLLAQTAVFTSQGVPFMLCGEEMLRDKKGVHNSYESPDSINQLNWNNLLRYPQVFDYYKKLIALRSHHPAFRLGSTALVARHLTFLPTASGIVAFCLKGNAGGDAWRDIYVVLNASKTTQQVSLPLGSYTTVCRDGKIDENGLDTFTADSVEVRPQTALIIHN